MINRPARRILVIIAFVVLLAAAPAVSAEEYSFTYEDAVQHSNVGSIGGPSLLTSRTLPINGLKIHNSQSIYGCEIEHVSAKYPASVIENYAALPENAFTDVELENWATAGFGYFKYMDGKTPYLHIFLANIKYVGTYPLGYNGEHFITFTTPPEFIAPTLTQSRYYPEMNVGDSLYMGIGTGDLYYNDRYYPYREGFNGYYAYKSVWRNDLEILTGSSEDKISVYRSGYNSKFTVSGSLTTYTDIDNYDYGVTVPTVERPYNVSIINPVTGKSFLQSINIDGLLIDDPGDPSRVMVHIIAQDARNENLLLDAAVEVRDQYDAVVAAGTTSPEGWMVFEYDLPDTLTDEDFDRYYTVSVSLPGWTQKVTNFKFYPAFIPRSGDWIRVEMLPDTDGPADPEKTYIMFFVRDIHANPLERASIEIAGQYWHTNSAGHVAVEVPKNSTTAYTVRKTGHVSISGSAAVGAEGSYVVNIALGPALPDRTPGPGDDPGATPPPRDTRTNEEKGKAVIDLIADNAELIATLAILAAVMGLINLIMPGRRRR